MGGRVFEQTSGWTEGWTEGKVGEWLDIVLRVRCFRGSVQGKRPHADP